MKRYILLLIFAVLAVAGCKDDKRPAPDSGIVGEWHLSSWNGESPAEDFDVYLGLYAEGYFSIWQKVETSTYVRYDGSFTADGTVLSGIYDDGVEWSTSYSYSLSDNGRTLTMTADSGSGTVSVYSREAVPDEVLAAGEGSAVKASAGMAGGDGSAAMAGRDGSADVSGGVSGERFL